MTFEEFLDERLALRDVIVGRYHRLWPLQQEAEGRGVLVRHGFEDYYDSGIPKYHEDESYPPSSDDNQRSVAGDFHEAFVVNCGVRQSEVTALPKGVSAPLHPWRLLAARPRRRKTGLAYANFSLGHPDHPDYIAKRERVYATIKDQAWITFENMGQHFGNWDLTWLQFYQQVARHRFTISPEGNGVDCHRTWEALYLKSVPIVQRSVEMSHFEDLPILFTDDYSELTPEYLNAQYARMLKTEYAFEKLRIGYWKDRIRNAVLRARSTGLRTA